mgnify:CR=1 FL=1
MKKKSKFSLIIICLIITLVSISLSYAYWRFTFISDNANKGTSGCFNIELAEEKDEINLTNAYPITDAEGLKLKPYSFTLRNSCSIFAHYYVNLEMLEGTTLNSKFIATKINSDAITTLDKYKTATTTMAGSTEARTIAEGYLGAGDSIDYTISFWMDEDVTINDDAMNKVFKSKIVTVSEPSSYSPVTAGYNKLGDAILANEYQTTPEIAKTKIASKQAVDLSHTAPIIKWVEKTANTTTVSSTKPASTAIKSDDQMSNLTETDTKIALFTTKTFNGSTGRYSLSNPVYVDPTEVDFSGDTKYYFQKEYMSYNQTNKKIYVTRGWGDITIYQVTGATKTTGTTNWNNVSYDSITYKLNVITLTETELETDKSDKGLYQATDDYGTTYYYRGNVKNNIVYFANIYWQIVRINGDGSIRLMYDGTVKSATYTQQSINNSTYQFNSNRNDPAYVGYMYGNPDGSTFEEVHTNTISSTIKTTVDNWYKTNIVDKGYSGYVSNAVGFCGDRTIYSGGDGVQTDKTTYFGAFGRHSKQTAQFTCPNKERDLYTTTDSSIGNKALTYPVGLIAYDELVFAGMDNRHINKLSWAYSTQHYWTMSPSFFDAASGVAKGWYQYSAGSLAHSWVTGNYGARPVINLKSDVKITEGIGTANDPFVVETN